MKHPCPVPLPRYTREQERALEHIGGSLVGKYIDWSTAVQLRDQVRAGEIIEVLRALAAARARAA